MINQAFNNYHAQAPAPSSQGELTAPKQREESIRKKICSWDQCNRENPKMICVKCKLVSYCDANCQKSDLVFHQTVCKKSEQTNIHVRTTSGTCCQETNQTVPVDIYRKEDAARLYTRQTGERHTSLSCSRQRIELLPEIVLTEDFAPHETDYLFKNPEDGRN